MRNLYLWLGATLAIGCGPATDSNPRQLWLALNGSERAEQLVALEPEPF
jgi:hypothetical protein